MEPRRLILEANALIMERWRLTLEPWSVFWQMFQIFRAFDKNQDQPQNEKKNTSGSAAKLCGSATLSVAGKFDKI
jgi:hypothetical protein